jgi:hypothetical protein
MNNAEILKSIDKQLKNKDLSPDLRAELLIRKNILLNDKEVKK